MTPASLENVVAVVAELLHDRIGLRPDQNLRGRLRRAIIEEAARHRDAPTAYADRLLADRAALQGLLNVVTVQETGFFRHPEQFEILANDVLPTLAPPVRMWSAGCANGQEAYSLAMVLEEQQVSGEVIATDLSTTALRRTAAGRYTKRELSGLSPERLSRHFNQYGDTWHVDEPIRNRVRTLHHNLIDPLPAETRSCHVVFCRNVLIYLSPEQARRFLDRLVDALPASLTLFVGTSETIWQVSDRFEAVQRAGSFLYRPSDRSVTVTPTPATPTPATPTPATPRPHPRRSRPGHGSSRNEPRPGAFPRPTPAAADRPSSAAAGEASDRETDLTAAQLERMGQDAIAAGEYSTAVVAFRKAAYLRPQDPLAQLHLGLALEAIGDERSARRAFAAARSRLLDEAPDRAVDGIEGYSAAELLRFLESRT